MTRHPQRRGRQDVPAAGGHHPDAECSRDPGDAAVDPQGAAEAVRKALAQARECSRTVMPDTDRQRRFGGGLVVGVVFGVRGKPIQHAVAP